MNDTDNATSTKERVKKFIGLKYNLCRAVARLRGGQFPGFPLRNPVDTHYLMTLMDPLFQQSLRTVRRRTLLDGCRLANLWQLAQSAPPGAMAEIGTYKGGGALHMWNAANWRKLYVCDTFDSFADSDLQTEPTLHKKLFSDTSVDGVRKFLVEHGADPVIIKGCFPRSMDGVAPTWFAFVHLDVDTYDSTLAALRYLDRHTTPQAHIVVDDYMRGERPTKAVRDFVYETNGWQLVPMFPGQGLLIKL
jgi:predicted O-methyltransferase YrrM